MGLDVRIQHRRGLLDRNGVAVVEHEDHEKGPPMDKIGEPSFWKRTSCSGLIVRFKHRPDPRLVLAGTVVMIFSFAAALFSPYLNDGFQTLPLD